MSLQPLYVCNLEKNLTHRGIQSSGLVKQKPSFSPGASACSLNFQECIKNSRAYASFFISLGRPPGANFWTIVGLKSVQGRVRGLTVGKAKWIINSLFHCNAAKYSDYNFAVECQWVQRFIYVIFMCLVWNLQ